MPQSSSTVHEEGLSAATRDLHRALVSLQEELEAIDWYQQRVEATDDAELREILKHNRGEEVEHAAMVLEWIRRHDPDFSAKLKTYLFTEGSIVERETSAEAAERGAGTANGRRAPRGIGSLRGGGSSTRGGDFVLTVGGDLAVGYRLHDREAVHLFCVETIAPQTVTPEAVCVLEAAGSSCRSTSAPST